jgi:hypothetical protein
MIRIVEYKHILRIASLVLLYLAMFGPWAYDKINVPAKYSCNFPNIRLEGDFCGVPLSGIRILFMAFESFGSMITQYLAGTAVFLDRARELLFVISFILLPLPFFSTMYLLFNRNTRGLQVIHFGMWALGSTLGLYWAMVLLSFPYSKQWSSWGLWSYLMAAIGMLIFESLVLKVKNGGT